LISFNRLKRSWDLVEGAFPVGKLEFRVEERENN